MTEQAAEALENWRKVQDEYLVAMEELLTLYKEGKFKEAWRFSYGLALIHDRHQQAWNPVGKLQHSLPRAEVKALVPEMDDRMKRYRAAVDQVVRVLDSLSAMGYTTAPGAVA
jgi:hypothetical protein